MDHVGMRVEHRAFGRGTIIAQSESINGITITVKFDARSEPKKFSAPGCFASFLRLLDDAAAKQASADMRVYEEKIAAEKAREERERRAKAFERRTRENAGENVSHYSTLGEFFDAQERLLASEIAYLSRTGGKRYKIMDGKKVEFRNDSYGNTAQFDKD